MEDLRGIDIRIDMHVCEADESYGSPSDVHPHFRCVDTTPPRALVDGSDCQLAHSRIEGGLVHHIQHSVRTNQFHPSKIPSARIVYPTTFEQFIDDRLGAPLL